MFMPDHVHLLLRGLTETAEMTAFVADFKHATGWQFRRERRRRLWREGFHDRVLRDESDALSVLAYLVANPVRAGLVSSPSETDFLGLTNADPRGDPRAAEKEWRGINPRRTLS